MRTLLDSIITEKAAKDLITLLQISIRSVESYASATSNEIFYQDVIARHFMDIRHYDLTGAGRYKMYRKLRPSERLYQRVLAEDILTKNDKVLLSKGTLILKDELQKLKQAYTEKNIKNQDEIKLNNPLSIAKKQSMEFESFLVYTDNDLCDITTPIIGGTEQKNNNSLSLVDFISAISYTVGLPHNIGQYDDIDHLGNKRLRLIHEQLRSKIQAGISSVEKYIKEKLASLAIPTANEEQRKKIDEKTTLKTIVNTSTFQQIIKNFFNSYQLTQFIDQQNPLSELTNKRRISAMGDGGISREDPNLNIRDVHYSHYGKICPIETPEGMNIGLILSLASFTRIDENGFLISPYKKVNKGVIDDKVE
jgi:DNA-directed RNA polymerase subunit beta